MKIRFRDLAKTRRRFGFQRLHILLKREGWRISYKRVYRLYQEAGLSLCLKTKKKRVSHSRTVWPAPIRLNELRSMDFVSDALLDGRRFRALTVVDNFIREAMFSEADFPLTGKKVAWALEQVLRGCPMPHIITVDHGSEFAGKDLDAWAYWKKVRPDFIRPGKPVENGFFESFHDRLRGKCLNVEGFFTLDEAREKLERWRQDYNLDRPHSALKDRAPASFAAG